MIKRWLSLFLASTMLISPLASANSLVAISKYTLDLPITRKGFFSIDNFTFQSSKLYEQGIRDIRLSKIGGTKFLTLFNAEKKAVATLEFAPTPAAKLAEFTPSKISYFLHKAGAKLGPTLLVQKAKEFPREAVSFAIAIGAITFLQLWNNYNVNPMAFEQYVSGTVDPFSNFAFYMFLVGSGLTHKGIDTTKNFFNPKTFEQMRAHPQTRFAFGAFATNNISMLGGMMMSHAVNDFFNTKGMRECAQMMSTMAQGRAEMCNMAFAEYGKTWSDSDLRSKKLTDASSSAFNLFAAATVNTLAPWILANSAKATAQGTQAILKIVGVNIGLSLLPGGMMARAPRFVSWTLQSRGLQSLVNASSFMAFSTALEESTQVAFDNYIHTNELENLSACLGMNFERMSSTDQARNASIAKVMNYRCSERNMAKLYSHFVKASAEWRNINMTPVINARNSWEAYLKELIDRYTLTEELYQNITEKVDAKIRAKPGTFTQFSLDATMPYFGVIPSEKSKVPNEKVALSDEMLAPLYKVPIVQRPEGSDQAQEESRVTWGSYVVKDIGSANQPNSLEGMQDQHVKAVAKQMLAAYMSQTRNTRPLNDVEIEFMKRYLRYEKLNDPTAHLDYELPPAQFSEFEMAALWKLISKLYSSDRNVVGEGLTELYRSISPELTGNTVRASKKISYGPAYTKFLGIVYQALGQPLPMMNPGRGYLSAWTMDYDVRNKDQAGARPFPKDGHYATQTLSTPEYLVDAMIFGPRAEDGQLVARNTYGYAANFRPPRLIPDEKPYALSYAPYVPGTNDERESIFSRMLWLPSDKTAGCDQSKKECYKPMYQWIREGHLLPGIINAKDSSFRVWWNNNVKPQYLAAWKDFEMKYEDINKMFLQTFFGEDRQNRIPWTNYKLPGRYYSDQKYWVNNSAFKNGVLAELNQERQIALVILSRILGAQYQPVLPKDDPAAVTMLKIAEAQNGQLIPLLQNYDQAWKNGTELFLSLYIPLSLMKNEAIVAGRQEDKFVARVSNQSLVQKYKELEKMVDELEAQLKIRADYNDDEIGDYTKTTEYAVAKTALESLRNSHEEMLDYGLIINTVSYVERTEDRNGPIARRCVKSARSGGSVPFGTGAQRQEQCR